MLHTKLQGHQPFGSGEKKFLKFLPYMGMAAILVMWPGPFEQTFVPPYHGDSIWNLASIGPVVSEEKMFKECGRRTDDGWTDRRQRLTYPISSPMSLRLRWAKKERKRKEKENSCLRIFKGFSWDCSWAHFQTTGSTIDCIVLYNKSCHNRFCKLF